MTASHDAARVADTGGQRLPTPAVGPGAVPVDGPVLAHAGVGKRPLPLQDRRIPSRNATVRRRVVDLYRECSWLTGADLPAAARWGTLTEKFRRLAQFLDRLPEGGVVRVAKGDVLPYKALETLLRLNAEITKLEAALGVTAAARAGLGVDLTRMRKLAQGSDGDQPEADVEALEQRIVQRLSEGQHRPHDGREQEEGGDGA